MIQRAAFTLFELLVALAVLAFVVAALFALTQSTLRFTGLTRAVATSVEDVAEAEGYIADMFRNAKDVLANASLNFGDGDTFSCVNTRVGGLGESGRCIALVTPVLGSQAHEPIEDFVLSVFAVVEIGDLYVGEGLARGWSGPATLTMVEYRVPSLCGAVACDQVPSGASSTTWGVDLNVSGVGYLLGGLAGRDGENAVVEFFRIPDDQDYSVELNIVARADSRVVQPFVVRRTPLSLQVAVR